MLKIRKRLDFNQEEEYIKKVAFCMRKKDSTKTEQFLKDFFRYICSVLREIRRSKNIDLYNDMINYLKNWKVHHVSCQFSLYKTENVRISYYIMAWLVMPQELMKAISSSVKNVCGTYLKADARWKNSYTLFSNKNINNWVVDMVDNKVCPYCNLSFIYNRSSKKTTAELDHFYNKNEYPLFALNFYNLIPACYACNHIKSDQDEDMISPYEDGAYDDLTIDYEFIDDTNVDYIDLENNLTIKFDGSEASKKHLEMLLIDKAYDLHKDYAEELIQKIRIFNNKAARELIQDGIDIAISTTEFEQVYFGKYRHNPEKRILGKMTHDFLEKRK